MDTLIYSAVDLGPGMAVGGMRIEINTGHSRYMICDTNLEPEAWEVARHIFCYCLDIN